MHFIIFIYYTMPHAGSLICSRTSVGCTVSSYLLYVYYYVLPSWKNLANEHLKNCDVRQVLSLTYNRTGLLDQYFLPEVMRGQLNVTNTDEF